MNPPLSPSTILLLTLPPLFWAGNAVLARWLVGAVSPMQLSLFRWVLALAVLLPFVALGLRQHRATLIARWKDVLLLGVLGVGAYNSLQYLALQTSTPITTSLIASSTPVFVLITGALFFGNRTLPAQWLGAGLSVLGVLIVLARGQPGNLLQLSFVVGDLIMLCANLSWTFYTWFLRQRRPDVPFLPLLAAQMIFGVLAIAPFTALEAGLERGLMSWTPQVLAVLLYIAVLPSVVAYACWDRGVARVGAVIPVYFANLTPVFTAVLSMWMLGEAPHPYHALALLLIVAGIHLASRKAA